MMFQSYALFPHLTVAGNIAFGLSQDGLTKADIAARVEEMLALRQTSRLRARKPHQLSGGQRQRVALARSLAKRPEGPSARRAMAALDRKLREETQFELVELQSRLATTFVIVTHDQEEAMTVAHRIGVMDAGRLIQVATPADLYEQPNSRWVAAVRRRHQPVRGASRARRRRWNGGKGWQRPAIPGADGRRRARRPRSLWRCGRKKCEMSTSAPAQEQTGERGGGSGVGYRLSRRSLDLQGARR